MERVHWIVGHAVDGGKDPQDRPVDVGPLVSGQSSLHLVHHVHESRLHVHCHAQIEVIPRRLRTPARHYGMTGVAAQGGKWNRRPKGRGEGWPGGWISEPLENSKEG